MTPTEEALRRAIVGVMVAMQAQGLNRGTSGNVSARFETGMLITPSGVTPDALTPGSVVKLDGGGADGAASPESWRPSSEWRMHAGVYARRPDVQAVVHCHSRHATILACVGRPIPALHYMVGVSGRSDIPLAPYSTFGTDELAAAVVQTLGQGYACLMANHGQIVAAPSLSRALSIAEEVEEQAAVYVGTLQIGGPNLLSAVQMDAVFDQFRTYGQTQVVPPA